MDFWVAKIAGKQFLLFKEETFSVEANLGKVGDKIVLDQILLTNIDGKISIGTPLVTGAKLQAEIVFSGKGEKLHISKFKAKSRYRKVIGFRPFLTKLKVLSLGEEEDKKKIVKKKTAK